MLLWMHDSVIKIGGRRSRSRCFDDAVAGNSAAVLSYWLPITASVLDLVCTVFLVIFLSVVVLH